MWVHRRSDRAGHLSREHSRKESHKHDHIQDSDSCNGQGSAYHSDKAESSHLLSMQQMASCLKKEDLRQLLLSLHLALMLAIEEQMAKSKAVDSVLVTVEVSHQVYHSEVFDLVFIETTTDQVQIDFPFIAVNRQLQLVQVNLIIPSELESTALKVVRIEQLVQIYDQELDESQYSALTSNQGSYEPEANDQLAMVHEYRGLDNVLQVLHGSKAYAQDLYSTHQLRFASRLASA